MDGILENTAGILALTENAKNLLYSELNVTHTVDPLHFLFGCSVPKLPTSISSMLLKFSENLFKPNIQLTIREMH